MIIYDSFLALRDTDAISIVFVLMGVVGSVTTLLFAMSTFILWGQKSRVLQCLGCALASLAICVIGIFGFDNWAPQYQAYKIVITDASIMPDLLKEYEIVDQEGQILTIKAWEPISPEDEP